MQNFTPYSAFIGGMLIGLSATLMLWINGRITGISGIVGGILFPVKGDSLWRVVFVAGLLGGGLIYVLLSNKPLPFEPQATPLVMILAGLLVGWGTRMGSGCTSGHGICGIARISRRSFAATLVFMLTAIVTVWLTGLIVG